MRTLITAAAWLTGLAAAAWIIYTVAHLPLATIGG